MAEKLPTPPDLLYVVLRQGFFSSQLRCYYLLSPALKGPNLNNCGLRRDLSRTPSRTVHPQEVNHLITPALKGSNLNNRGCNPRRERPLTPSSPKGVNLNNPLPRICYPVVSDKEFAIPGFNINLRDWLLPMLMNGQISVGAAKKAIYRVEEELSLAAEPE